MPTKAYFDKFPPFPDDVPLLDIPKVSYAKLLANDPTESKALWDASLDHGFFKTDLSGSEGANQLLDDVANFFDHVHEYCHRPLEEKQKLGWSTGAGQVIYKPVGKMQIPGGKTDLFEVFALRRDQVLGVNGATLPSFFAKDKELLASFVHRLHPISWTILTHLAKHLEVSMGTMERLHDPSKPSTSVFTLNGYPAQPANTDRQIALAGHTDSGSITMLFMALGGLQILPANLDDKPENWRWVKPEPGCAVVNLGDPLRQWTGGLLRSSFHRVMYPPGEQSGIERFVWGYMLKPEYEASMRRIQEGSVIPKLTPEEMEADEAEETYLKSQGTHEKKVFTAKSPFVRGGRPATSKTADTQSKQIEVQ